MQSAKAICRAESDDADIGVIDFGTELERPTARFIGYDCEIPEITRAKIVNLLPDFDVSFDALN